MYKTVCFQLPNLYIWAKHSTAPTDGLAISTYHTLYLVRYVSSTAALVINDLDHELYHAQYS